MQLGWRRRKRRGFDALRGVSRTADEFDASAKPNSERSREVTGFRLELLSVKALLRRAELQRKLCDLGHRWDGERNPQHFWRHAEFRPPQSLWLREPRRSGDFR